MQPVTANSARVCKRAYPQQRCGCGAAYFPAGLVLYWLTNNILGIAQQWFINKKLGVT